MKRLKYELLSFFLPLQSVFTLLMGPFTFFNAQKTKYLQILTSLMRWIGKNEHINTPALFSLRNKWIFSLCPSSFSLILLALYQPCHSSFFLHTYIFPYCVFLGFIHSSHLPAFDCVAALLRSVHHCLILLSVPSPPIPQPDKLDSLSQAWLDRHSQDDGRK